MEIAKNFDEFKRNLSEASFIVAYGKNSAEPIAILPGTTCNLIAKGEEPVPIEVIQKAIEDKKEVKIRCTNIFYAYGSPGCQLMIAPGVYVCVCCPPPT